MFNPEKCLAFIRSRADLIDAVVITGGEPLLQDSLPGFLSSIKELGLLVKVDTNGTLPHRLHHLIDEALVDYVALDIKAPVGNPGAYCVAAGGSVDTGPIRESVQLLAQLATNGEYRTTVLPGFHDYDLLVAIVRELPFVHPFYLQLFIPELARTGQWTRQPRWSRERLENIAARLSIEFPNHEIHARA